MKKLLESTGLGFFLAIFVLCGIRILSNLGIEFDMVTFCVTTIGIAVTAMIAEDIHKALSKKEPA